MTARELTPIRLARLRQIILQLKGPCLAVIDQAIWQRLSLTDQQNQAIARACHVRTVQMREALQSAASNFCTTMAGKRDHIKQVRGRADDENLALVELSQKKVMYLRTTGKKLDLTPPIPPEGKCRATCWSNRVIIGGSRRSFARAVVSARKLILYKIRRYRNEPAYFAQWHGFNLQFGAAYCIR